MKVAPVFPVSIKNNATNTNTKKDYHPAEKNNRKSFSKSPLIPFIIFRLLSTSGSPDRVIRSLLRFPDNFLYNTASRSSDRQLKNSFFLFQKIPFVHCLILFLTDLQHCIFFKNRIHRFMKYDLSFMYHINVITQMF